MSQPPPTDVQGLFINFRGYEVDTHGWHVMLRDSYSAGSQCKLQRVEFCKTRNGKLHEFLILYFSHYTHASARAAVVVDRIVQHHSQSSAIVSPSLPAIGATPARDRVHVVGQNDSLNTWLSNEYGAYCRLCVLDYHRSDLNSSIPQPPSAVQLSTLLLVITEHQPDYNLYEHNCYWFADMVFEASKKLFPGHQELCHKHGDRGRCRLKLQMLATHNLSNICEEYSVEWGKSLQNCRVDQQELEEERRAHAEERRAHEEERRAHEEERRGREEERRGREAAERHCKQLEAELQAGRQAQLRMPVN